MDENIDDLEYRVGKLHLEPDDILVVKINTKMIDLVHIERIRENAKLVFGDRATKILVLDSNIDISVLTRAEIEERT